VSIIRSNASGSLRQIFIINSSYFWVRENLFFEQSALMVSEGYLAAGYNFISLDDCWMDKQRGPDGKLRADPNRFPSGIKVLSDYVRL